MYTKKIVIKGTLTTKTGVAIGGTKDAIGMTSADNPVITNPLTGEPYIPGSSIKGKMRSLFEKSGLASKATDRACTCGNCLVCKLFGSINNEGRVHFGDALLAKEFRNLNNIIESKSETAINRNTGIALTKSLRETERVAAGVDFDYEIIIFVDAKDDADELLKTVENGLKMLEITGIGKKTSTGYGRVDFHVGEPSYSVTTTKFMEA